MNKSYLAAGTLLLVLVLWMGSGLLSSDPASTPESSSSDLSNSSDLMRVEVQQTSASTINREITLQGQLEPRRWIDVRSETSGTVESIAVVKGARISEGATLAKLSLDGRDSRLREAEARIRKALSEQSAALKLQKQGLQSQVQLEQAQANLATARADLEQTQLDIRRTTLAAPFAGVINGLPIEIGQQLERGDVVAQLVDDSSFVVSAMVAQQTVATLSTGQPVKVRLITGQELVGTLTFISALADSATRSFRVEAAVENTSGSIAAGVSASMVIPVETVEAVFLSPSAIALGENGDIGVKTVNDDDVVEFHTVRLVQTNSNGAWVTGLPTDSRVITLGQGFVNPGQQVIPVPAAARSLVNDASGS